MFLSSTPAGEIYFQIEIALIVFIVLLQIYLFVGLLKDIAVLRSVFKNRLTIKTQLFSKDDSDSFIRHPEDSESESVKISLVESKGKNSVISRIEVALNSYLLNNFGAPVNFSIIKDIIDREVDAKDEEISQSIPTPLYLGLAATMLGIIFGLLAMPEMESNPTDTNNTVFSFGLNALINGVKLAMFASLTGLLFTTLLSSLFYKKAKKVVLRDKNDQLSYLQAKLLPELIKAEDTGVSGLKESLDKFAREATKITSNVRTATEQTGDNIQKQLAVISKVERLNMTKISRFNLELFDRLEGNMEAFRQFSNYLSLMEKISVNLADFSARSENMETIANEIKSTLNDSKNLSRFLTEHFNQIENAGRSALNAVNLSDSHFREAIQKLTEETTNRINTLNNISNASETTLKQIFEDIGIKLNEITDKHLNLLTGAYNNSLPRFEHLDNLKVLPEIKSKSENQTQELINAIAKLNTSLDKINSRIVNNQDIISKLESIEKGLKRRGSSKGLTDKKDPKKGFFQKVKSVFGKKKKAPKNEEK